MSDGVRDTEREPMEPRLPLEKARPLRASSDSASLRWQPAYHGGLPSGAETPVSEIVNEPIVDGVVHAEPVDPQQADAEPVGPEPVDPQQADAEPVGPEPVAAGAVHVEQPTALLTHPSPRPRFSASLPPTTAMRPTTAVPPTTAVRLADLFVTPEEGAVSPHRSESHPVAA
ncbi:MAG: hypothetical protein M3Z25_19815, partial [Actinomycetota bacterium]|nr:hypothetical protein [Actinomycetota bacterium]